MNPAKQNYSYRNDAPCAICHRSPPITTMEAHIADSSSPSAGSPNVRVVTSESCTVPVCEKCGSKSVLAGLFPFFLLCILSVVMLILGATVSPAFNYLLVLMWVIGGPIALFVRSIKKNDIRLKVIDWLSKYSTYFGKTLD